MSNETKPKGRSSSDQVFDLDEDQNAVSTVPEATLEPAVATLKPTGRSAAIDPAKKMFAGRYQAALLANDGDVDGDALSVTAVASGTGGMAQLVGDHVLFTPTAGFSGAAKFSYTLSDGALSDTAEVTVNVAGGVIAWTSAPPRLVVRST